MSLSFVMSKPFQWLVTAAIIANFAVLLLSTEGWEMTIYEDMILAFFVFELVIKFIHLRGTFHKDGWNIFDAVVVGIGVLPWLGLPLPPAFAGLRTLRLLKIVSLVPAFRSVIEGLVRSLSGMIAVSGVLSICMTIAALMATLSFQPHGVEHFSSFERSFYTCLQLLALDNVSAIVAEAYRANPIGAWITFPFYFVSCTFVAINLVIGVVSNAFSDATDNEKLETKLDELTTEVRKLSEKNT